MSGVPAGAAGVARAARRRADAVGLNHLFLKIDADCDGGLAWHDPDALLLRGDGEVARW